MRFGRSATMRVVSLPDLYGGKLCAELDRQHTRDLFDVHGLFSKRGDHGGHPPSLRDFSGQPRPSDQRTAHPKPRKLKQVLADQFAGMTIDPVPFAALETARDQLIERINADLTNAEREFLLSMKRLEPKWELLDMPGIERLPGPQTQVSVTDRMIKSRAGISILTLSAEPSVDDRTKEVVPDSG